MDHRARKRFGQHFLHDPHVIRKILVAISPKPGDVIVEIGPGLGAITQPLLEKTGVLTVIELDRDVIPHLQSATAGRGRLEIVQGDALKVDLRSLAPNGRKIRLVGNLPYNISTPLLFRLLDQADCLEDMHVMLQKEVVQRMAARPGGKEYGRLTVMLSAVCRVEPLFTIGPGAFRPPPKVESAFVRLVPYAQPPFLIPDRDRFAAIVRRAFSHRRKTLRNALAGLVEESALIAAGLEPGARPETISPAEYARLAGG